MSGFDYDNGVGPDVEIIRSIAGEMANSGNPPPMSDTEREEWRQWSEQQEWLREHQQRERERVQSEQDEARIAQERQTAALALSERNTKMREEMRQRSDRQMRDAQIADLHRASVRNEQFRAGMMRSSAFAVSRQDLDTLLTNYMDLKYPPPAPEPTVVVVEQEDGDSFCGVKIPRWR